MFGGELGELLGVEEVSAIFFHLWDWSGNHNTALYHALYPPLPDGSCHWSFGSNLWPPLSLWMALPQPAHLYLLPLSHPCEIFRNYLRVSWSSSIFQGEGAEEVSHITHLGGLLFGLIYMAYPVFRQKIRREYYKRKWSQKGPGR